VSVDTTWDRDVKDLAGFEFRQAVVEVLRERAETTCSNGELALLSGDWKLANGNWRAAAQRKRAAKALHEERPVHADDVTFVEQACSEVRDALWARFAEKNGLAA
jgi:hypothetical protein